MNYQDEEFGLPCVHVIDLRKYMELEQITISSEHGEPHGWVNVHCSRCRITHEILMMTVEED